MILYVQGLPDLHKNWGRLGSDLGGELDPDLRYLSPISRMLKAGLKVSLEDLLGKVSGQK